MQIKELNKAQAMAAMKQWQEGDGTVANIDPSYKEIRRDICEFMDKIRKSNTEKSDYYTDVHMGMDLYQYFDKQPGFSMRTAANDNFWRYLSVQVVPDVVAERWGRDNADHFWRIAARIWLRQIWWYVYLSWQGDIKETEAVLLTPRFSTDTILNLAERTGRNGTYVEIYRYIMYYYSTLDMAVIEQFNKKIHEHDKHGTLFRTIMKLNTARTVVTEPSLYLGGCNEFVRSLFREVGIVV